ncbi:MAG: lysylphosphatidylglycerol synthase transmembrane domain-containing protein [Croceibacterium sp.]
MAADAAATAAVVVKRALPIVVSAILLAALWWRIDARAIVQAAGAAKAGWLIAGVIAVIPLTWGTAVRFQWLSRTRIGTALAGRLILAASTLNLVLPSKMGDLAKAWVLERRHGFERKFALSLVVFEKLLDLSALLVWGMLALIWMRPGDPRFVLGAIVLAGALLALGVVMTPLCLRLPYPARIGGFVEQWHALVRWFWGNRRRAAATVILSLALWAGHLAQLWLFARALGQVPAVASMAAATLSILAGLLPFTMAGVGTRDLAIVYFYRDWLSPAQCAALGMLATLRYLLPAVAGLPFVSDYWRPADSRP